jgi:glycosyltransferase involved in cell wall biosynthesis
VRTGTQKAPAVCMIAYTNYVIDARVRREAETLASNGFRVCCLTNRNQASSTKYVLNGVEVIELPVSKYRGKSTVAYLLSYLCFLAAATVACVGRLAAGKLDVVHVHNLPDFLVFAAVLPRLAGKKVVLDIHDSMPETFATKFSGSGGLHKALCLEERMSAAVAHKVICVNHPQRDVLAGRGIPLSKTFVSMNVPDPKIFAPQSAAGSQSNGHLNLVYHGTMAERLGVDLVIRAVAELRERIPCLTLHLWGTGDDLASFQQLAAELGVQERVSFRPKGFRLDELPGHLVAMDLGVVGNRSNVATDLMLPVKLLEYVSLGIPAVVPRLRTIDHYFSEDMVAYFEPESVSSLAETIHRLYCQPSARRRQAASASKFLERYGWDRQGTELVAMYNRLVEN